MDFETRLENEIRLIEEDESLTEDEKSEQINELYRQAKEIMNEEDN